MLSGTFLYFYAECRYADCRYAGCRGATFNQGPILKTFYDPS